MIVLADIKNTCIIIPCYNEENRLNTEKIKCFKDRYYFLLVNDGSKDNTLNLLNSIADDDIFVLNLTENSGKAEAVRQGMLHALTLPFATSLEWIGFWDADLSTSLEEIDNFFKYDSSADAIFGSRVKKLGSDINRTAKRHYLGRLFATVSCSTLKLKCYDSQCGAKLFKKEIVKIAFDEKFLSRWIFDVEILIRLEKCRVVEYPLKCWKDIKGSKIKMIPTAWNTFFEIYKIKKKYRR